jgi:hypothetical protein
LALRLEVCKLRGLVGSEPPARVTVGLLNKRPARHTLLAMRWLPLLLFVAATVHAQPVQFDLALSMVRQGVGPNVRVALPQPLPGPTALRPELSVTYGTSRLGEVAPRDHRVFLSAALIPELRLFERRAGGLTLAAGPSARVRWERWAWRMESFHDGKGNAELISAEFREERGVDTGYAAEAALGIARVRSRAVAVFARREHYTRGTTLHHVGLRIR